MDPARAMKAMRTAYDFYGKYKTLEDAKKGFDFAVDIQKMDRSKITREQVRLFKNKEMTALITNLNAAIKHARSLKKLSIEWPKYDIDREISEIAKAAKKVGIKDKKIKGRISALYDKINELHMTYVIIELACVQGSKRYDKKADEAKRTADYMTVLHSAFRDVAMVPQGYSTAPQAAFIELSEDARHAKGLANELKSLLNDIVKQYDSWHLVAGEAVKELLDWAEVAGIEGLTVAVEAEI